MPRFPNDGSLRWQIINNIHQAIFEDSKDDPAASLLYKLICGHSSTSLTAYDIITFINNIEDSETFLSNLTTQIIFLASEYPFLQPQLASLITTILSNPTFPEEPKSHFTSHLSTTISDTAASNYAHLLEESQRTKELIEDHINLHRFQARLLPIGGIVGLDDAMYMLSVGLEDHPESHDALDVDLGVAAGYMVHAAEGVFDACLKGVGQDLANPTPLFTTRGRSWTGPAGFSSERWNLWKCRFAAVERSDAALETKALAQTAVRSMVLVDGMTVP